MYTWVSQELKLNVDLGVSAIKPVTYSPDPRNIQRQAGVDDTTWKQMVPDRILWVDDSSTACIRATPRSIRSTRQLRVLTSSSLAYIEARICQADESRPCKGLAFGDWPKSRSWSLDERLRVVMRSGGDSSGVIPTARLAGNLILVSTVARARRR